MGSVIERRKDAVAGLELIGRDGDGLVAVGLAVDPRRDQVAQPTAAQEVADADEPAAVPREKDRATACLAVVLGQVELLVGRDVELALNHPVGPAEVDQVGFLLAAQSEHERSDRLAQAGLRRRVVVSDVDPLPFDEHAGSDRVRVGPHQLGLDPPVSAELEGPASAGRCPGFWPALGPRPAG